MKAGPMVAALLVVLLAAPAYSARPVGRKALALLDTYPYKSDFCYFNVPSILEIDVSVLSPNFKFVKLADKKNLLSIVHRKTNCVNLADLLDIQLNVLTPKFLVDLEITLLGSIVVELDLVTRTKYKHVFLTRSADGLLYQVVTVLLNPKKGVLTVLTGQYHGKDNYKADYLNCHNSYNLLDVDINALGLIYVDVSVGGLLGGLVGSLLG